MAMSYADTHYDVLTAPGLAGAVISFLDAASLEPPAPSGP
jgi:hypothetical protein